MDEKLYIFNNLDGWNFSNQVQLVSYYEYESSKKFREPYANVDVFGAQFVV